MNQGAKIRFFELSLHPDSEIMRKLIYLLLVPLFLLVSCKSKKEIVALPKLTLQGNIYSIDSSRKIDSLFVPNYSGLRELNRTTSKEEKKPGTVVESASAPAIALRSTKITESIIKVSSVYPGIDRIRQYEFTHRDVPEAFEGFRIAFISDLHYKSLFKKEGLDDLVRLLIDQHADVLLMGGDYQEGCQYVPELFNALAQVKTPYGTYGVMGNNDYERCHDEIVHTMKQHGMHVLEQKVDTLKKGDARILIAGVRNPFDLRTNGKSPTLGLSPNDFVILLVHTPDYVEDVSVANTDLALAGHTHGGQVVVFGIAPIVPSHYGQRFLSGLKYNSAKIPVIVTNGLGTSNKNIRIGAPSEIVMITLHRLKE